MIDRACISVNSVCNLDCPYCHFGSKKNNEKSKLFQFQVDEVDVIINNLFRYISTHGIESFKLGIVGSGEPMLSFEVIKKIVELIGANDHSGVIKLYMITNGTIMTDEHLDFFYKHKDIIEVNFSLDGFEALHNRFRSAFELTMRNIQRYENVFCCKPKINTVVTRDTLLAENELFKFFSENHFINVNFSRVFGVDDPTIEITQQEYLNFLSHASIHGIIARQTMQNSKKYDCTKYGKLCGVGRTNIFITKLGVFPCARFMGNPLFKLGEYHNNLDDIEYKLKRITPVQDGECYYEYNKVGE